MLAVTLLRDLWRYRIAVVGVWVVAMAAGALVLYDVSPPSHFESRKYQVGEATTSILIDTPSSQVVEIAPEGSEMLGVRADLFARLMTDGVVKDSIAKAAGMNPRALVGIATSAIDQAPAKVTNPLAPVLTTRVVEDNDGTELPIVEVHTQAATLAAAAKLADASVVGLRDYLNSKAAQQAIPNARRLQVSALGATQAATVTKGPKNVFAVAGMLFVLGFGVALILLFSALRRSWHAEPAPAVERRPQPYVAPVQQHHEEAMPAPAAAVAADAGRPAQRRPAPVPAPPASGGGWMSAPARPSLTVAPDPPGPPPVNGHGPTEAHQHQHHPVSDTTSSRRRRGLLRSSKS